MSESDHARELDGQQWRLSGPGWIVSGTCAIALLHFGRPVLEPIAVAGVLTLTLAPLVRRIRLLGLAHGIATFLAVGFVAICVVALGAILASQLADIAHELPGYRVGIRSKLDQVSSLVVRPLERWESEVAGLWPDRRESRAEPAGTSDAVVPGGPIQVEIRKTRPEITDTLSRFFTSAWGPVAETVVVLVLLLFMLLGRDSIRERLIRLAGEKEVARTMQALADTDEGVSRFFASLVVVNTAFAAVSSVALTLVGVPHAVLWGTLAGVMRFVPYVGVPTAIAAVAFFAAAADPGWSLALWTIALLLTLDLLVANVIEPHVYGHTMGVAPFGIIVAALFWSALWGPVGLIVSAPLTLCLVVAGRHVSALAPVAILFGDAIGSTRALRVYQRGLAGDAQDVLDEARVQVRREGLARYCDEVLLPAFALGSVDHRAGRIDARQDQRVRRLLLELFESLRRGPGGRRRPSLTEATLGLQLRRMREARLGPSQGSLDVPARSVVLCAGLAKENDELLTEMLVRALRDAGVDARSMTLDGGLVESSRALAELVSVVLLVYPGEEGLAQWRDRCRMLRKQLPQANFVAVRPPDGVHAAMPEESEVRHDVELVVHSFSEALSIASHRDGAPNAAPEWGVSDDRRVRE